MRILPETIGYTRVIADRLALDAAAQEERLPARLFEALL